MIRRVVVDPEVFALLDELWEEDPDLALAIEESIDWIEADPPAAGAVRRVFTDDTRAVTIAERGRVWHVFWAEAAGNVAHVLAIVEDGEI